MQLASRVKQAYAELYTNLSRHFVEMMDILQALRFSAKPSELDSLLLLDYSQQCDSQYARRLLRERYGQALIHIDEHKKN